MLMPPHVAELARRLAEIVGDVADAWEPPPLSESRRPLNTIGLACSLHDPAIAIVNARGEVTFAESAERHLQEKRAFGAMPDAFFRIPELLEQYCDPGADLRGGAHVVGGVPARQPATTAEWWSAASRPRGRGPAAGRGCGGDSSATSMPRCSIGARRARGAGALHRAVRPALLDERARRSNTTAAARSAIGSGRSRSSTASITPRTRGTPACVSLHAAGCAP